MHDNLPRLSSATTPRRLASLTRGLGLAVATVLCLGMPAGAQGQPPTFSKSFGPSTIGPGSTSTLQFDIVNSTASPVQNLAFSDTLPAGVTLATPANPSTTCEGALTAPDGGSTITLVSGRVGGSSSCWVRVAVTSATAATHTNVSGPLTSSAGNSGSATADLTVATGRPGFSKSFSPGSVFFGQRSRLTFTIDNTANGSGAASLTFTDNLPSGMVVASPAARSNTCTGGTFSAPAGSSTISYTPAFAGDGSVGSGSSCTLSVDVVGNSVGLLINTSGELTSIPLPSGASRSSGKATAALAVSVERIALAKSFTDDPVAPGGTVELEFTVRNLDRNFDATAISFSDDLGAVVSGLAAVGLPLDDPCGSGSSLSGTGVVTLTGGTLPPEGVCTFSVSVQVPAATASGSYTNTTGNITADIGGQVATGDPASDLLFVEPRPVLTKEFTDDPVGAGEDVTLRFTVLNTSAGSAASDIAFVDELTTFLPFPVVVTLPGAPCGGSMSLISLGTERQGLSLTGGSLAAGASCTFDVTVTVPVGVATNTYVNVTEEITATIDGDTFTGDPATDDLVVVAAPDLSKEFTDDPVAPGDTVTLEFTLLHDENAPSDATAITFSDDLDAALSGLVATGLPANDVCGAGSQLSGTMTLLFTGGTLAPGEACTFSAVLDVPGDAPAGPHTNTTSSVVATVSGTTASENPASDDLEIAGLTLTKEFVDDPVRPGETVTLRFTIDNVSPASDATDIVFTDDLDGVLDGLVATGLPVNDVCGTGSSLAAANGNTLLVFQDGALTAGTSCVFDVVLAVPADAADDTYFNFTSALQATIDGSTVSFDGASDALAVASELLALTKEFIDDPVGPGDSVTLRFTVENLDGKDTVVDVEFTDDLDAALAGLVSTSGTLNDVCGVGSQLTGASVLSLTGGNLAAGTTCSFDVGLTVPLAVPLGTIATNTTSKATGSMGGLFVQGPPASDDLRIDFVGFTKAFDGPTEPGGDVVLTFTITNNSATEGVLGLTFSDDLDAVLSGLIATGLPAADVCGAGSSLAGTSVLQLSGGNLLPGGSCTFAVTLSVPAGAAGGFYLNVTSDLEQFGTEIAQPATAELEVIGGSDDDDEDGVPNDEDVCADTEIPEAVPTHFLRFLRYALVDADTTFDVNVPAWWPFPVQQYDTTDTAGCSCDQILDEVPLPAFLVIHQEKFGCFGLLMKLWTLIVDPDASQQQIDDAYDQLLHSKPQLGVPGRS